MSWIVNFVLFLWACVASYYCYDFYAQLKSKPEVQENLESTSCKAGVLNNKPTVDSAVVDLVDNLSSVDPTIANKANTKEPVLTEQEQSLEQYRILSRLSAIEKFVQINNAQREELKEKFKSEINKQEASSLEEILGKESADFYHQQVKAAYEKSQKEEVDKEVFYLARVLNLSEVQESSVRQVISDVKGSVDSLSDNSDSNNPIHNLQKMLDSVKVQNDLLSEKIKAVLSSEQYLVFQTYQNNSSNSDFTLLHTETK